MSGVVLGKFTSPIKVLWGRPFPQNTKGWRNFLTFAVFQAPRDQVKFLSLYITETLLKTSETS